MTMKTTCQITSESAQELLRRLALTLDDAERRIREADEHEVDTRRQTTMTLAVILGKEPEEIRLDRRRCSYPHSILRRCAYLVQADLTSDLARASSAGSHLTQT